MLVGLGAVTAVGINYIAQRKIGYSTEGDIETSHQYASTCLFKDKGLHRSIMEQGDSLGYSDQEVVDIEYKYQNTVFDYLRDLTEIHQDDYLRYARDILESLKAEGVLTFSHKNVETEKKYIDGIIEDIE